MAIVTGPLISLDARGGFAGTLVATAWKGRKVMRQLVTPANPKSTFQEDARNSVRVTGIAQHWANFTTMKYPAMTLTDKARIMAITPSGQAWNGFLVKNMIGVNNVNMDAADAAYGALTAPQKTAWVNAAAALTPPITDAPQYMAGGLITTAKTKGNVFFDYVWGLYVMGLAAIPGAVPPVYV